LHIKNTILIILIGTILSSCSTDKVYYIDAENRNNRHSGQSPDAAWASLEKVNETIFQPGDQILFKAGAQWEGQLELKGSGTSEAHIRVNRYGKGKNPAIHGKG
jgi:hypothetical protein